MRQLLTGLVVAATTAVMPVFALADNQEVADEIAKRLRDGGQLQNYKIGVKFQDGTAWLKGRVHNQEQLNAALKTVFETCGVTRVVNGLTVGKSDVATSSQPGTTARFGKVESDGNETTAGAANPIRPSIGATAPEKTSTAQRLERVIGDGMRASARRVAAKPATGRRSHRAELVSDSFTPAPVREAAATESVATPRAIPRTKTLGPAGRPIPVAYTQAVDGMTATAMPGPAAPGAQMPGGPIPAYVPGVGGGVAPARYDQPHLPNHAWPSYAAYPNYANLTYPRQYSPTAWPFIGPFYPYPQVPLGWRKVTLEWDDGWWMLDFEDSAGRGGWCP